MAKEKGQEGAVTDALSVPKARVLAEVFAPNGKIRVELLPEGAGGSAEGGSVDLQPLEKRVAALEAKPEAEHVDLNPLSERVAALESHLTTAQNMIDWLGGDLLRVTPMVPSEGKWVATRTFPLAVRLPEGLEARTIDKVDRSTKIFTFKLVGDGKNVPAHTPVLLFGKEKKEYVLSPGKASLSIDTGLMGTVVPLRPEQLDHNNFNYYALAPDGASASLKRLSATMTFPAYRAYIRLPKDYFEKPAETSATES